MGTGTAIICHIKRSVWLLSAISADLSLHGTVRPSKPINESN